MDFYIDGGGSTGGGGLPTGWDTGSPGVTGGGGSSGAVPSYSGGPGQYINSWTINTYNALNSSDFLSPAQKQQLYALKAAIPAWANNSSDLTGPIAVYNNALLSAYNSANDNYNQYNNVINLPNTAEGLGLQAMPQNSLPSDELSLLGEYGQQPKAYDGPTYSSTFNAPYIGAQSAYDSWKNQLTNDPAVKEGLDKYANEQSIAVSKPFMPNGAPVAWPEAWKTPTYDAELQQLFEPKLEKYNPLKSDWNGNYKVLGLDGLFGGNKNFNPFSKLASQYDSPSFTGSGLLAQAMAKGMEGSDPQRNSSNPWQSKNLIKPASYFDDSSQGIAPPKGLMGQDMITQNNVLPALQMALINNQVMPDGNEAMDAATKPLTDAKGKGNATERIEEARNKWKSDSLNKFGNWQSLA